MNSNLRVSVCAMAALALGVAGAAACSDSNEPAGAQPQPATGGSTQATGGTEATGGAEATGGDTGAGGASTDGSGGVVVPDVCNYPTESQPPPNGVAACPETVKKGEPCTVDGEMCYRNCGPRNSSGWKTETCTGGIIVEVSTCEWTGTDYSAFRIPAAYPPTAADLDPNCPPAGSPPQATVACSAPPCVSCTEPGTGQYRDSSGSVKPGWCTCAADASGDTTWSCGTSGKAWPCPGRPGC
jgi:hypothetical protein